MVDGACGLNQLLHPRDGFYVLHERAEQRRVYGDGGGRVEVAVLGGPPERGAQVRQLIGEPDVGIALTRAVPQREDVCFAPGKVAGVRGTRIVGLAASSELLLGEL